MHAASPAGSLSGVQFETRVECLDEVGRTENISVFVMRKGNPVPLISALIKMPVSESVIVV